MPHQNLKDPLHGATLEMIMNWLVEHLGWEKLADSVHIRCFHFDPTVSSSLTFLRRTPWARKKVENLYVKAFTQFQRKGNNENQL